MFILFIDQQIVTVLSPAFLFGKNYMKTLSLLNILNDKHSKNNPIKTSDKMMTARYETNN